MYFHPTENQKREVETENQKDGWKQLTRACALIGFHPFAFGSFGFLSTSPRFSVEIQRKCVLALAKVGHIFILA